jgi:hypothetical protein
MQPLLLHLALAALHTSARQDQSPPRKSKQLAELSLAMAQAAKYFSLGEVHHGAGFLVRRPSLRGDTSVLCKNPIIQHNQSACSNGRWRRRLPEWVPQTSGFPLRVQLAASGDARGIWKG